MEVKIFIPMIEFNPNIKPVVFVKRNKRSSNRYLRTTFYANFIQEFGNDIPIWVLIGNKCWIQRNGSPCLLKPKITISDVLYDLKRDILVIK